TYLILLATPMLAAVALANARWRRRGWLVFDRAPLLVTFSVLYLALFIVAVQFSDFRAPRYRIPIHPIVYLLTALAVAYCVERREGSGARKILATFVSLVVVTWFIAHSPVLSLERPGYVLEAPGYSLTQETQDDAP